MCEAIKDVLLRNRNNHVQEGTPELSWINRTCKAIGFEAEHGQPDQLPPAEAIAEVRRILVQYTQAHPADKGLSGLPV